MSKPLLQVIIASVRQGRVGKPVADYIVGAIENREKFAVEVTGCGAGVVGYGFLVFGVGCGACLCFAVGLAVHVAARFALNFRTHVTSALKIPHSRILQRSLHGVCGVISGTLGGRRHDVEDGRVAIGGQLIF